MEAKCPVNLLPYEWEWPWIDHDRKTKAYQEACKKKADDDAAKLAVCNAIKM